MCFKEKYSQWPARNGRPAGEAHDLMLIDMTKPSKHALDGMYDYRLRDEEMRNYWGKTEGRILTIATTQVVNGQVRPVLRGEIIGFAEETTKKL